MRKRSSDYQSELLDAFKINSKQSGRFLMRVDWLIEYAATMQNDHYARDFEGLWSIYMPSYEFNKTVFDYFNSKYVLHFIQKNKLDEFKTFGKLKVAYIESFIKNAVYEGECSRLRILKACFDNLKSVAENKNTLHDDISKIYRTYFGDEDVSEENLAFLKRFSQSDFNIATIVYERLKAIYEQSELQSHSRQYLANKLKAESNSFQTTFNCLLCKLALEDHVLPVEQLLQKIWQQMFPTISYHSLVFDTINKYDNSFILAYNSGIKKIENPSTIKELYRNVIVMMAQLENKSENDLLASGMVWTYWGSQGGLFGPAINLNEVYNKLRHGLNKDILIKYEPLIRRLYDELLNHIRNKGLGGNTSNHVNTKYYNKMKLDKKDSQIEALEMQLNEFNELIKMKDEQVIVDFITALDSKKYNHTLSRLYRYAYFPILDDINLIDIQSTLRNLFEIMKLEGVTAFGELGTKVSIQTVKNSDYRIDEDITNDAVVEYPGFKINDRIILSPCVKEK